MDTLMPIPTKGRIVFYTAHFDSDQSAGIPNINPAIVVDVNADTSLNLFVLFVNGSYTKTGVVEGSAGDRGTWHWPPIK